MRWSTGGNNDDVEDRRSEGGGGGGGIGGVHMGVGGLIVLGILSLVFKTDLISPYLGGGGGGAVSSGPDPARDQAEAPGRELIGHVATDTNDVWTKILAQQGVQFPRTKVSLFRDEVQSACGSAQAATGPFYCPGDSKIYLDLGFFDELKTRFGGGGDFAEAYVIAHEMGHHVQNVLGIERKVRALQQRNPAAVNQLSVKLELQADCLAGVWGKTTDERHMLEAGEAEQAIKAASAIGDDRLQKQATGRVTPDSFTHGSSAQRVEWFQRGFQSGDLNSCDTFEGALR